MGLTFLGSPWLLANRNRNLCGFIGHDVVHGKFDNLNLPLLMLTTPICVMLILLLGAISTHTHDLLIPKKSAITAVI
jgi:hypothetical protein